jgi:hypothetical protein
LLSVALAVVTVWFNEAGVEEEEERLEEAGGLALARL